MLEASLLVIGDEILGGFVHDTNSHWLAQRLLAHGVPLSWIHTIPDSFADVDEALQSELARARPRLVVTSGGIGSTPDDITFEAVAASLGRELVEEPLLVERIDGALAWTRAQGIDVDDRFRHQMLRMARIPAGSQLLSPEVSWAPGIRMDVDGGIHVDSGATLIVLPGVPSQFRAIIEGAVEAQLLAGRNEPFAVEEITHGFPESALNACFLDVLERYPDVKVGSYPGIPMMVRLLGRDEQVQAAAVQVRRYLAELQDTAAGRKLAAAWAERLGGAETEQR